MTTDPLIPDSTLTRRQQHAAMRIVDAAANRASEGLRVVEDFTRFCLDDSHLTALAKALRHDLAGAIQEFDRHSLLAARETQSDVGAQISTPAEQQRDSLSAIVAAAFKRLEQSLRSLEEYSKLIAPAASLLFENLRYRTYTLERIVQIAGRSQHRLKNSHLYVLMDGRATDDAFRRLVQTLTEAGVDLIQLRDKSLTDRVLLERGLALRELTRDTSTLTIINDRPDIAALCDADGLHVGQDELTVKQARTIVGPESLIGVSTHSLEQAKQAVLDGADYIGIGPTFASTTKAFDKFPGLAFVRDVAQQISLPAFAIGGITIERATDVVAAGLGRVAVGAAIIEADDPRAAVADFLAVLDNQEPVASNTRDAIQWGANRS